MKRLTAAELSTLRGQLAEDTNSLSELIGLASAELSGVRRALSELEAVAAELEDLEEIRAQAVALFREPLDSGAASPGWAERSGDFCVGEAITRAEFYRSRVRAARSILSALAELLEPEIEN